MSEAIAAALPLLGTIVDLIQKAQAARAANQAEQAALIEKQLADATADYAAAWGGLPAALRANDTAADQAAAAKV